ncbi:S41 family peptidase [Tumebacillus flagellatus]|uniref:Tail specific protease domain-containing protein n=1 Tax=Tumebacillus flagellatus TaxID=1157490 RepID=A0A074LMN7_9BACL|nr:S41 family peptidase [Tumebacillus flagellatus]KEO82404.1 hypothetical protein EL26_15895 [Tumebacillus flagellatus]
MFIVEEAVRETVLRKLAVQLKEGYVFPEIGAEMATAVLQKWKSGAYDAWTAPKDFALGVTADLRAVSRDLHVTLVYSEKEIPPTETGSDAAPGDLPPHLRGVEALNFGFAKVERLAGNVGYLKLDAFFPPDLAGETLRAAMSFLSHTGAMILDLRENSGGWPELVQWACSYFLGAEPVLLNTIYARKTGITREYWSLPDVPGDKRYEHQPLYVLTSRNTFSAAEELTYNLQQLGRAKIVGEVTRGGANPGEMVRLQKHFSVFVPTERSINPITQTNWEGIGVTPDVQMEAEAALDWAYREALRGIAEDVQARPQAYPSRRFLKEVENLLIKTNL